jgi:diadenosine tetraphosphate (Ap4A) HIT family hydrolase
VQCDAGVLREPRVDLWVLVGVVVVDDDVQLAAGVGLGDLLQEVAELGLAVPVVARVGDLAGRDLESGEQRGGAVAFVVYCVFLTDEPSAQGLTDLPRHARTAFLDSTEALAEAVELACRAADPAFRRINIEIHGNQDPFLHAHVWPRYGWEPPDHVGRPVALYPMDRWHHAATAPDAGHRLLMVEISRRLRQLRP